MQEIVKQCQAQLRNNLYKPQIKEFFEKRGLSASDIDTFGFGYAHQMTIEKSEIINRLIFLMSDIDNNVNSLSCRVLNYSDALKVKNSTK